MAPKLGWPGVPVFDLRNLTQASIVQPVAFVLRLLFVEPDRFIRPHGYFLSPSEAVRAYRLPMKRNLNVMDAGRAGG